MLYELTKASVSIFSGSRLGLFECYILYFIDPLFRNSSLIFHFMGVSCSWDLFRDDLCLSAIDNSIIGLVIEIMLFLLAFGGLAVASEHLCNSMETLCERWKIHEDVGGATFIALGNAIPEITINCISTYKSISGSSAEDSGIADLGIGAILGSGMIAYLLIPASCRLLSEKPLLLRKRALYRDAVFYSLAVIVLGSAVYFGIAIMHAPILVSIYACYVLVLVFSDHLDFFWSRALGHPHLGPLHPDRALLHADSQDRDASTRPLLPIKTGPTGFDSYSESQLLKDDDDGGDVGFIGGIQTLIAPINVIVDATCPDCRLNRKHENLYPLTFVISMVWISLFSFIVTVTIERWVALLDIPGASALFGFVLVAVGAEIPDSVNAVTIARRGYGGMAISACLGSQVVNICLGLGMPWLIATCLGKSVPLSSNNWFIHEANILVLLAVIIVVLTINKLGPVHSFQRSEITTGKAWALTGCYVAAVGYLAYSTSIHKRLS